MSNDTKDTKDTKVSTFIQKEYSKDLKVLSKEINKFQRSITRKCFEIGARLNWIKENDLAHGEFGNYLASVDIDWDYANRVMKIEKELGANYDTYRNIGYQKLYIIAQIPEEERNKSHLANVDTGECKLLTEMSIRELRKVKKYLCETEKKPKSKFVDKEKELEKNLVTNYTSMSKKKMKEILDEEFDDSDSDSNDSSDDSSDFSFDRYFVKVQQLLIAVDVAKLFNKEAIREVKKRDEKIKDKMKTTLYEAKEKIDTAIALWEEEEENESNIVEVVNSEPKEIAG